MIHSVFDEFEMLAATVLEGDASREEIARFNELIREFPDLFSVYVEQLQMHLTLQFRCGRGNGLEPVSCDARESERHYVAGRKSWWRSPRKMAAAAVVTLLAGTALWHAADFSGKFERYGTEIKAQANPVLPVVRLVSQKGVRGHDLPETLPGMLRLESGEVAIRLDTGVELTLIGPSSVAVESGIRVALDQGSLLANVPHWATGFTVRTRALEIRDLGTVFGVRACEDASDVFVFKGSVQVNEVGYGEWGQELSGAAVGICGAGEGVRAVSGESPSKIAADWPEAKKLFGAVQAGRAVDDPVKAMKTASQIADLWAERYMPGSSLPAKKMRVGNGIPFQNKAWVRASVPQQEGNNMNRASAAAALAAAAVMMGAGKAEAVSDPVSVNFSPHQNRYWTTVLTNEVPLRWNWNAAATHAELDIRGMNASFTTNFTGITSNYLWRTFAGSVPEREDAYTLTLRFYNGNDVLVGAMTSKLAVVTGAFGKAVVDPGPAEKNWARIRDNVVIPYDSTWAAATADAANGRIVIAKIGGTSQTNAFADASSYYGLKLKHGDWEYGAFFLALTFPGHEGEWNANVVYVPNGTLIRVK